MRIRLPRGSVADVSPPSSKSTEKARPRRPSPSSRKSNRSLEWKPDPSGLLNPQSAALINNVAMTELLDQDERPSFIIDLTDSKNYGSGSLQVLYANFALRGFTILWDTLLSSAVREPTSPVSEVSTLLPDFKGWCTSRVHRDHPYEPVLSTYNWCGLTWSASVVRKRLRVFSGVGIDTVPSRFGSDVTPSPLSHPGSERRWRSNWSTGTSSRTPNVAREATDYFSSVPLPPQQATFDETEELTPNAPVGGPNAVLDELETPRPRPYDLGLISPQLTPPAPIVPVSLEDIHSELTKDAKEVSDDKPPFVDPVPKLYGGTTETSDAESPSNDPHANFFDWTRLAPGTPVPEHIAFARGIDWSSTSLGPMSEWPITLRTMCNLIMASPHPAAMYWGDELIAIYNEAYIPIAGQKHPELMGQSYIQAWGEIWDQVKGHFVDARETGQAIMKVRSSTFV